MIGSRGTLWGLWAGFLALLALELAFAYAAPARLHPWYDAQTSVAGFVLALLAMITGVGTFTLRESLALRDVRAGMLDPGTPEGFARMRRMLVALWALCLTIGALGCALAYGAASPRAALPYLVGAAVLLGVHAPRGSLFAAGSAR